jgi:hypothetical protein
MKKDWETERQRNTIPSKTFFRKRTTRERDKGRRRRKRWEYLASESFCQESYSDSSCLLVTGNYVASQDAPLHVSLHSLFLLDSLLSFLLYSFHPSNAFSSRYPGYFSSLPCSSLVVNFNEISGHIIKRVMTAQSKHPLSCCTQEKREIESFYNKKQRRQPLMKSITIFSFQETKGRLFLSKERKRENETVAAVKLKRYIVIKATRLSF